MFPRMNRVCSALMLAWCLAGPRTWAEEAQSVKVQVHWDRVIRVSQTKPTLLLGASPALMRGAPLHDQILKRVEDLGADDVRSTGGGEIEQRIMAG